MTRFDILSWHSDNEISKEKKKKRKSISRLQFCLKFFSLALMFMQLSTCFTYIYICIATMTFFVSVHTSASHFTETIVAFVQPVSGKSFGSILFPSNLNNCCNDDYVLCIVYFFIHFHFHWKNLAK